MKKPNAKTGAAKIRRELNLTFTEMPGASLATIRKWERSTIKPSGAAKTLLAVAKLNPDVIKSATASFQ